MGLGRHFNCSATSYWLPGAQCALRQFPSGAERWLTLVHYGHLRSGAARLSPEREWQPFCCVFGRGDQRENCEYAGDQQSAIASEVDRGADHRAGNRQGDGQYSEWKFRQSGMHEWWNQQRASTHDHLTEKRRWRELRTWELKTRKWEPKPVVSFQFPVLSFNGENVS